MIVSVLWHLQKFSKIIFYYGFIFLNLLSNKKLSLSWEK